MGFCQGCPRSRGWFQHSGDKFEPSRERAWIQHKIWSQVRCCCWFFVKHIPAETALLYLHTGKGAVICSQVPWRQNTVSRYWYTQNTPEVINVLSEMISLHLHTIVEWSDIASNNDRVEKTAEMSAFQFNFLWIKCSGLQNVETSLLAFTPVQRLILPVLQSALCEVIHLYRVCCVSIKPAVRLSKLELMKSF